MPSPDGTPLSDNQKKKRAAKAEKERLKAEKAAKLEAEKKAREAADVVSVGRVRGERCGASMYFLHMVQGPDTRDISSLDEAAVLALSKPVKLTALS